jgi:hypothetical protein
MLSCPANDDIKTLDRWGLGEGRVRPALNQLPFWSNCGIIGAVARV